MKIGIDLTPLQGPHRMRGIGYTVQNFVNNLDQKYSKDTELIFYMHPGQQQEALDLLSLGKFKYTIRTLKPHEPLGAMRRRHWVIKKTKATVRTMWVLMFGNPEGASYQDLDWFIQLDQNKPLPAKRSVHSLLVLYDLIPYVLEHLYLCSYKTCRKLGKSRLRSFASQLKRTAYIYKARLIARQATQLVAISKHTKEDFIRFAHIPARKIEVGLLGISDAPLAAPEQPSHLIRYRSSSWGPMPQKTSLPKTPYLLFVGGADPRRKLVDLVAAFNNLRAEGVEILLLLSGDTMMGPDKVGSAELHRYLKDSAYVDDIYFLGYTDDRTREWLYQNALAFVWPSVYEGFGLPVLEAMRYGTPVITYKNSSIPEIAGDSALYADGQSDIIREAKKLLASTEYRNSHSATSIKQAEQFRWATFSDLIISLISS